MKLRVFTVPVHDGQLAESELNQFLSNNRIVSIEKHFVESGNMSFWSFCVTWTELHESLPGRKEKIDYKQILNERDFSLFAKLRDLRKKLADEEGVPPYALFTNEQLAELVKQRISSKAAMAAIKGVGSARVEKYGTAFIDMIKAATDHETNDKSKNETQQGESGPHR